MLHACMCGCRNTLQVWRIETSRGRAIYFLTLASTAPPQGQAGHWGRGASSVVKNLATKGLTVDINGAGHFLCLCFLSFGLRGGREGGGGEEGGEEGGKGGR